jgi:hypothetical protein
MKSSLHRVFALGFLLLSGLPASAHPNHSFAREGVAHQMLSPEHWLPSLLVICGSRSASNESFRLSAGAGRRPSTNGRINAE